MKTNGSFYFNYLSQTMEVMWKALIGKSCPDMSRWRALVNADFLF